MSLTSDGSDSVRFILNFTFQFAWIAKNHSACASDGQCESIVAYIESKVR